jgi:hypothetical protein
MDVLAVAEKFCAGWTSLDAEGFSVLFAPEGRMRSNQPPAIGVSDTRCQSSRKRTYIATW